MEDNKKISLPDFSDLHVLVIGDVMIDRYISGKVKRISPEAPVPVVELDETNDRLGGAANVAVNLHELGAKVTLLSVIGSDEDGDKLKKMTYQYPRLNGHFVTLPARQTTVKTRVMSDFQHLLRIDKEDTFDIENETELELLSSLENLNKNNRIDGIVLQDYNKGILTKYLIENVLQFCNQHQIPSFVDPKEKNFFSYKGCTVFKPNKKEINQALPGEGLKEKDSILRERLNHKLTIITLGSEGIYMNDNDVEMIQPTHEREIADVCGAGDSVISAICLCYLKNINIHHMAIIANTAGGQVCERPGVVSLSLDDLKHEVENL